MGNMEGVFPEQNLNSHHTIELQMCILHAM